MGAVSYSLQGDHHSSPGSGGISLGRAAALRLLERGCGVQGGSVYRTIPGKVLLQLRLSPLLLLLFPLPITHSSSSSPSDGLKDTDAAADGAQGVGTSPPITPTSAFSRGGMRKAVCRAVGLPGGCSGQTGTPGHGLHPSLSYPLQDCHS